MNFYRDLQDYSYKKADCFIMNGCYTTPTNNVIKEYSLFVVDNGLDTVFSKKPKDKSINMLIDYAKENYEFDSYSINEYDYHTWLIFKNLKV